MTMDEVVRPVISDEAPAVAGPALLQPLRLRDFRLVFAGETISVLGDQFHFVALAWLALQLTGSGLALGTVLMTAAIPAPSSSSSAAPSATASRREP